MQMAWTWFCMYPIRVDGLLRGRLTTPSALVVGEDGRVEGEILEGSEARIPVMDHGLLYGDGVFEGLRVYARRVFRLADHLDRMEAGARSIGLTIPRENK